MKKFIAKVPLWLSKVNKYVQPGEQIDPKDVAPNKLKELVKEGLVEELEKEEN